MFSKRGFPTLLPTSARLATQQRQPAPRQARRHKRVGRRPPRRSAAEALGPLYRRATLVGARRPICAFPRMRSLPHQPPSDCTWADSRAELHNVASDHTPHALYAWAPSSARNACRKVLGPLCRREALIRRKALELFGPRAELVGARRPLRARLRSLPQPSSSNVRMCSRAPLISGVSLRHSAPTSVPASARLASRLTDPTSSPTSARRRACPGT